MIEELDASNNELASYVYGDYIDDVVSMRRGGNDYFYHADDQFNVVALTDENDAIVEQYEYSDFGEASFFDGAGNARADFAYGNPYLFNSRRYDDESGLYWYRPRYLDPAAGRFISESPLAPFSKEEYAYCNNSPSDMADTNGLESKTISDHFIDRLEEREKKLNQPWGPGTIGLDPEEGRQLANGFENGYRCGLEVGTPGPLDDIGAIYMALKAAGKAGKLLKNVFKRMGLEWNNLKFLARTEGASRKLNKLSRQFNKSEDEIVDYVNKNGKRYYDNLNDGNINHLAPSFNTPSELIRVSTNPEGTRIMKFPRFHGRLFKRL